MWNKLSSKVATVSEQLPSRDTVGQAVGTAVGSAFAAGTKLAADTASKVDSKVGASAARARARSLTAEEKQAFIETGVGALAIAAQVGQALGDPRVKAASGVAGAVVALHGVYRSAASTSDGSSPPMGQIVGAATERVVMQVVATVDAGHSMPVSIDGVGEFAVTVPGGIARGQLFSFEVDVPVVAPPPMGLPVVEAPPARSAAAGSGSTLAGAIADARTAAQTVKAEASLSRGGARHGYE